MVLALPCPRGVSPDFGGGGTGGHTVPVPGWGWGERGKRRSGTERLLRPGGRVPSAGEGAGPVPVAGSRGRGGGEAAAAPRFGAGRGAPVRAALAPRRRRGAVRGAAAEHPCVSAVPRGWAGEAARGVGIRRPFPEGSGITHPSPRGWKDPRAHRCHEWGVLCAFPSPGRHLVRGDIGCRLHPPSGVGAARPLLLPKPSSNWCNWSRVSQVPVGLARVRGVCVPGSAFSSRPGWVRF